MIIRPGVFINDRYEIIDKVGSGGMADVYKAKDHRLNRFVAMKILKAEFSNDTKFVEKFRAEAQAAAGLSHPNVVNVYDVGDEDGMYYIVMELVEGITLKSFIARKNKLDVKEAVGIAIQIAQGMEAAHGNHIVHRDIKPQNIIISRDGKVKVTDFGIAKAISSDTITSNGMGSVHYLSPEQARGGFSDEKSDIYSLGVTMYEMLTGRVPFVGDNTVAVALSHLQDEPVPIRDIEPSLPASLDRIVQKCMQKKPEYRYLSASALISDLKKSLSQPDGGYIQFMTDQMLNASPTINMTDGQLQQIREAAGLAGDTKMQPVNEIRNAEMATQQGQPVSNLQEQAKTQPEQTGSKKDEDDDDDDVNPKLEKLMSAGGVLAAVLILFIIIYIVIKTSSCFGGSAKVEEEASPSPEVTETVQKQEQSTVPSVEGLNIDDVKTQLEALGLKVVVNEETSDEKAAGTIISQSIEEGTLIDEDMEIILVVSSGNEMITVTDVSNRTADDAKSILEAQGFTVSKQFNNDDNIAEGKVIRTSPSANSQVKKGENITLYISEGPEDKQVDVPNLIGHTKAEAKQMLKDVGLVLDTNNASYDNSDKYPAGQIIAQNYSYGVAVNQGTVITVTYSNGPKKTYKYYAYNVSINDNPFDDETESSSIKVILTQDGKSKKVYSGTCDMSSFPLEIGTIEGYSANQGTLILYRDGVEYSKQNISFEQVSE